MLGGIGLSDYVCFRVQLVCVIEASLAEGRTIVVIGVDVFPTRASAEG